MKYKEVGGNRRTLPKKWTLKDGTQTGNFDLLPEAVHNDEGQFQCLDNPIVNSPTTHKLGEDTLVGNKWQREVVEQTQADIGTASGKRLLALELEIDALCLSHVSAHIDGVEKAHWMGVADKSVKKHTEYSDAYILYLEETLAAHIESRPVAESSPGVPLYPKPVKAENGVDYTTWDNLGIIQGLTAPCRDAAAAIAASLYQMTPEEINALPEDWVSTHILWP